MEIEFHGVLYTISITNIGEDVLAVTLEDKDALDRWRGEFAAKCKFRSMLGGLRGVPTVPAHVTATRNSTYAPKIVVSALYVADVEDITSKTGNFKKFAVFVRMLQTAVMQQSDSVFVDLLTLQDLELLKSKKDAAAGVTNGPAAAAARQLPASNKRYLILTYASEFDRVHYPLPLLPESNPDPQRLKAVIRQLRLQLGELQAAQQPQQQLPLARQRHRSSNSQVSMSHEKDSSCN